MSEKKHQVLHYFDKIFNHFLWIAFVCFNCFHLAEINKEAEDTLSLASFFVILKLKNLSN